SGAVTVSSGGHVAPGNSTGTLTASSVAFNAGSAMDYTLGTSSSKLNVTTASTGLGLDSGSNTITLNVNAGAGFGPGTYQLIDYDTAFTGSLGSIGLGTLPAGYDYSVVND